MHLKEFEILRKMMYSLKHDKTGISASCFSGPEMGGLYYSG
jgi:hypothetical protein